MPNDGENLPFKTLIEVLTIKTHTMKKLLLPFFALIVLASCSKDCELVVDHALIQQITDEITVIKAKRDAATTSAEEAIYQKQLDTKQKEMDAAVAGSCE